MRRFSPTEVVLGGCMLAFGASFLNTGFILNTGASVSHLTGDISRIGAGLNQIGNEGGIHVLNVTIATISFLFGAAASGFLFHHPELEIRLPYGRVILTLGTLLIAAHFIYAKSPVSAIALTSAACGTQNAIASRYRGVVLRTTHLTGLVTDLGIHLGMKIRGYHIEAWKLLIPICIAGSFLSGAICSGILAIYSKHVWILLAGIGYFLGGLSWTIYKRTFRIEPYIEGDVVRFPPSTVWRKSLRK